jgi:hypothetical protein
MKVLYLIRGETAGTLKDLMDEHRKNNGITVVDLRADKDYDRIVELIEQNDKVISW